MYFSRLEILSKSRRNGVHGEMGDGNSEDGY